MGFKMDKNILKFIKDYDISDFEIEDILTISPLLKVTSYKEFLTNCLILEGFGYPRCDMDVLLLANPNIFVMSATDLNSALIKLKQKYEDIEDVLKQNPYIL